MNCRSCVNYIDGKCNETGKYTFPDGYCSKYTEYSGEYINKATEDFVKNFSEILRGDNGTKR